MTWIVMPVLAGPSMTEDAIADCLAQSVDIRLLIVNQGVDPAFRERLEKIAEDNTDRVFVWHHEPRLPSLSATWNRALDFVWQAGGTEALVVNNDVRIHAKTVETLSRILTRDHALFVTAVGVTKEQFEETNFFAVESAPFDHRGGPDFSCYLISKECHAKFRFDENFIPAFCEDLDYHRRLMLAGEGQRIFSVNLPYLHLASQTLKQVEPQQRMKIEQQIGQGSRAYYQKKWGGPVNAERFWVPFGGGVAESENKSPTFFSGCGPTTPEIQAWVQKPADPPIDELCRKMLDAGDNMVPPPPPESTAWMQPEDLDE